jgi:hypothetical protein
MIQIMNKHRFLSFLVVGVLLLNSCNQFLDINTNPNFPEQAAPSAMLPGIIGNGAQQYFFGLLWSAHFVQNVAGRVANNGRDQFFLTNLANPFNDSYFRAASNIPPMIQTAQREGSPYYVGAGKTMMALILGHLTDLHGDIPYSQAFQGGANYTPEYDTQEQIYAALQRLLDEAIVEFNKPASANLRPLSDRGADIFYNGNVANWKRLAFSLKARHLNHLSKKAMLYNPNDILRFLDSGITSNAQDAQLQFNLTQDALTNGWGTRRNNMASVSFGRFFIDMLNGRNMRAGSTNVLDPRMRIIAPGNRGGLANGQGESAATSSLATDFYGVYNSRTTFPPTPPDTAAWYARNDGVLLIVTNAEMRFIEAEAAFRAGNRMRAYTAYIAGITAHCNKLGVPAAALAEYLRSASVAQSAGDLQLRDIMQQKYIATFLHPETWVDMRRMDFSADVYTGFARPFNPNRDLQGQFPRRFLPGQMELLYNPVNANREFQGNTNFIGIIPMWWDRP